MNNYLANTVKYSIFLFISMIATANAGTERIHCNEIPNTQASSCSYCYTDANSGLPISKSLGGKAVRLIYPNEREQEKVFVLSENKNIWRVSALDVRFNVLASQNLLTFTDNVELHENDVWGEYVSIPSGKDIPLLQSKPGKGIYVNSYEDWGPPNSGYVSLFRISLLSRTKVSERRLSNAVREDYCYFYKADFDKQL